MNAELMQPDRYPLSAKYVPAWVLGLGMGPNSLWQLEDLLADLKVGPGAKVLDLGCGKGATSVFLARECDVEVVAFDLWISQEELRSTFDAHGVSDRVTAVHGDVRDLPFQDEQFDAIVSIDAGWHAPQWWATHWGLTGLLDNVTARMQEHGRNDWMRWARTTILRWSPC